MSDENANVEAPETADPAVAEGATAKKPGAVDPTAAAAEERKFRLKYGKSEREMTEKELIAAAQKGWAADDRFQEASKMKKELMDAAKKADMDSLVRKLKGMDPMEFYKEQLKAELRRRTMSPEDKALEDKRRQLQSLQEEEKEILSKRESERMDQLTKHYSEQYDRELSDAITKNGLPKSRVAIKRAADIASKVVDMGLDPDWDLVVKEAKRQLTDEWKQLVAGYGDNDLLELFGDDIPKRIGKAMAARQQQVGRAQKPRVEGNVASKDTAESKPVDVKQWMKDQRKKFEEG